MTGHTVGATKKWDIWLPRKYRDLASFATVDSSGNLMNLYCNLLTPFIILVLPVLTFAISFSCLYLQLRAKCLL